MGWHSTPWSPATATRRTFASAWSTPRLATCSLSYASRERATASRRIPKRHRAKPSIRSFRRSRSASAPLLQERDSHRQQCNSMQEPSDSKSFGRAAMGRLVFKHVVLPDGTRLPLRGELISRARTPLKRAPLPKAILSPLPRLSYTSAAMARWATPCSANPDWISLCPPGP